MPDPPGRGKWSTPCCSHLVIGYVLCTVCTSSKLNSTICVEVARRHSACFEILRKGGAQLRRLVSHFHPRLHYSVPVPPASFLCKHRTWLRNKSCCCTKALVARTCKCWRDTEQVEREQVATCRYVAFGALLFYAIPLLSQAMGKPWGGCRASIWEKAYMFQNSQCGVNFATAPLPYSTSMQ